LPTSTWPIVTFLPDQILASDAMALETLPVMAPVMAQPPMSAVTSPRCGWPSPLFGAGYLCDNTVTWGAIHDTASRNPPAWSAHKPGCEARARAVV
jgi:hypothetical protein